MNSMALSDLARLRIEPVIAYRGSIPNWACDMDMANPFYTWWLVEDGHLRLKWRGGNCEVGPGGAVLIPPGLRRRQIFSPETKLVSISFWAGWEDGRVLLSFPFPLLGRGGEMDILRRKALDLCRMVRSFSANQVHLSDLRCEPGAGLRIRAVLDLFVSELVSWVRKAGGVLQYSETGDSRLNGILADLRTNLQAGPLPYGRWQDQAGLGKVQLDRLARRWLGRTLRDQRDEMLFRVIQRSLSENRESLKELATRYGFFDGAHFCRWVKQRAHKSPRELRNSWS